MHTSYLFKFAVFVAVFDAPLIESGSIFFGIGGVVGVCATFLTNSPTPLLISSLIWVRLVNLVDELGVSPAFSSGFDVWFFRSFSLIRICYYRDSGFGTVIVPPYFSSFSLRNKKDQLKIS